MIALDAKAFGEACTNIVLRAADARLRQRFPDGECGRVIAAAGRGMGFRHPCGRVERWVGCAVSPVHLQLRDRALRGSLKTPLHPRGSANRISWRRVRFFRLLEWEDYEMQAPDFQERRPRRGFCEDGSRARRSARP